MIISICTVSLFLYAHQTWATKEASKAAENTQQIAQQTKDNLQAIQDNMEKIQNAIKKAYHIMQTKGGGGRNKKITLSAYDIALKNIKTYSQTILEALQKIERTTTEKTETQEEQQDETPNSP